MKWNLIAFSMIVALRSSALAYELPLFGATEWPIGRCDVDTADPKSFHLGVELGIQRWNEGKAQADVHELWFFRCSRIMNSDKPDEFIKDCSLVRETLNSDQHSTWQVPAQFYSLANKNLELVIENWKAGYLKIRTIDNDVVETDIHFKCDSKSGEIRLVDFVGRTIAQAGSPPTYRSPEYRVPKESYGLNWGIRITGMVSPKEKK